MGNILIDMMGLLTRKRVVKKTEETDFLVLGRRPNPDDSMFNTPRMYNELISIKDLKAEFDDGEISGGGTVNTVPIFTPNGTTLGDSQLIQLGPSGNGLYQMRVQNTDRFIIDKPSSVTSGDPEYLITQDGNFKVSMGWDDDGAGFGYLYNWAGDGWRFGSAGNNPELTIVTTAGSEGVDITNDLRINENAIVFGDLTLENGLIDGDFTYGTVGQVLSTTGSGQNVKWVDSAVGNVIGTGTTNTLPLWLDGPNGELADSQIIQTKIDGGTIFDLNAVTTTTYTPAINTKLLDLNSGGNQKFSITQDGGGGVVLPAGGGVTNPGPSFNMGGGAFSNGKSGVAMGTTTTAFGNGSLAANFLTLASGGGASAFGLLTEAAGLASASFGNKTVASGPYSIASGQDSIASGQSSVAIGEKGDAQGKNTFVQGFGGTATNNNAVKFGYEGSADGSNSAKFGFESVAGGPNSVAMGDGTTANGLQSIATGDNNVVSGNNSFVGGKNSTVTGAESLSFGLTNTISANTCFILGNANSIPNGGFQSFVVGNNNNAGTEGRQKLIGSFLEGASQGGVYLGTYNDNTDTFFNKFQIGNGSSGARSNSLSISSAGNIKIPAYGSGVVTGFATRNLSVSANGQIIETANPTINDYLSFVCLLSQSGGTNPQPDIVLENSLDIPTPYTAFTRVSSGEYNLNTGVSNKFKLLKTIVFINGGSAENNHDVAWEVIDANNLRIYTHNSDGKLTKASLEIRTYN